MVDPIIVSNIFSQVPKATKVTFEILKENNQLTQILYESATKRCHKVQLTKGWGKTTIIAEDCGCKTDNNGF